MAHGGRPGHSLADFAITSTWREHWTLRENAAALERDGLLKGRVLGKTAAGGAARGLEIESWLRAVPYKVASFVILDDRDDMAMHKTRLVQTDPGIGLAMVEAEKAVGLLRISG